MNDIKKYALILIYPDGFIEKIKCDKRNFHMEYFVDLANRANRFKTIVKNNGIYLPDIMEAALMTTYDLDYKLATLGIIVIHNLFLDEEVRKEFDDYSSDYYISMPSELSASQKDILGGIMTDYDISTSYFCTLSNNETNELVDITYDDARSMIDQKRK